MLITGQIIASDRESLHFNALAGEYSSANIRINFTSQKLEWFFLISATW